MIKEIVKIRLADWRDRDVIQPLRRLLGRPVDGGLYELLNWPQYHAHVARIGEETVGFTGVILFPSGVADDVGTVVHPNYRRRGIGSQLRYTQLRDLELMGWTHLWCAAESEEAVKMCNLHFGPPKGEVNNGQIARHLYYGDFIPNILERLDELEVPKPFPLSQLNEDKLSHKAEKAIKDAIALGALADFNIRKTALRSQGG